MKIHILWAGLAKDLIHFNQRRLETALPIPGYLIPGYLLDTQYPGILYGYPGIKNTHELVVFGYDSWGKLHEKLIFLIQAIFWI